MLAAYRDTYGDFSQLSLKEIPIPVAHSDQVLVRVHACSINASDAEFLTGTPLYTRMWGLRKPKYKVLGSDISGEVIALGPQVKHLKIGDFVYGDIFNDWGGLAQFLTTSEKNLTIQPSTLNSIQSAALPQAARIALQGLKKFGKIRSGESLLINGAGGGSGSYAIQMAKYWGAHITAVDRADKFEFMKRLGADELVNYESEDFSQHKNRYDVILDLVAKRSPLGIYPCLKPKGRYILAGGTVSSLLQTVTMGPLLSIATGKKLSVMSLDYRSKDFAILEAMHQRQVFSICIDALYPLEKVKEAFEYFCSGAVKGKIVIQML